MLHAQLSCSFVLFLSLVPRSRYYRLRFRLGVVLAIAGIHPLHPPMKGDDKAGLFFPYAFEHNPHEADYQTAVEHAKAIRLQACLVHLHTSFLIT